MTKSSIAKTRRTSSGKTRTGKKSPKNTPAKKINSRLKPNQKHISKLWVAAGVVVLIAATYLLINGSIMIEQYKMAQYLKEKYGKEFAVDTPKREASGLGVEGYLVATARPRNDNTLRFKVMSSSSGRHDGYAGAVWTKREYARLDSIIKDIFGSSVKYKINIQSSMSIQTKDINIRGNIPSLEDASRKYGKQIPYSLFIEKIQNSDLSERDKLKVANDIANISKYLPKNTDTIITYIARKDGLNRKGLIVSIDDIKSSDYIDKISNMFKEWRVTSNEVND